MTISFSNDSNDNISLIYVKIKKEMNKHSTATVKFYLLDWDKLGDINDLLKSNIDIVQENSLIFVGTIIDITSEFFIDKIVVEIKLNSLSFNFDKELKKRIFQSTDKKWVDIFDKIKDDKNDIEINDSGLKNKEQKSLVVQYNITDFEFLLNSVKALGFNVFIDDCNKLKATFIIGYTADSSSIEIDKEDIYDLKISKKIDCDVVKFTCVTYVALGSQISYDGFIYTVTKLTAIQDVDIIYYKYKLVKCNQEKFDCVDCVDCVDYVDTNFYDLGRCEVKNRNDSENLGRLQVEFLDYEDSLTNNRVWINYIPNLTEKDVGVLYFPDKGEIVKTLCNNNIPYIVGCIREKEINNDYANTDDRIIKSRDKIIGITQDKIQIDVDKTKIILENDNISIETDKLQEKCSDEILLDSNNIKAQTNKFDIS